MTTRRTILGLAAAAGLLAAGVVQAQEMQFFRIGTGGTAGTYYPIGGLLANAISNPPGSRACDAGGSCGAPEVVATAVSSNGSVANVNGIAGGTLKSGFVSVRRRRLGAIPAPEILGGPAGGRPSCAPSPRSTPRSIHLVARGRIPASSLGRRSGWQAGFAGPARFRHAG